jgi:hypothetical protein
MQKTFGYQTGYAPSQVKSDPKKMAQMGSLKSISSGLDMFDLVKGHLLDEGYADTEEAAIAIMANMSEEWRESILDEADSLAAMQARREKRLKAQRKREGTTVTGRDFGRDDRLTSDQQKARREAEHKAGTRKEEFKLDEDSRRTSNKKHTARVRANIRSFGSNYTPPNNYDPDANRGQGEVLTRKQIEKKRRKALRQEDFEFWVDSLVEEGYDLSGYTWDEMYEFYLDEGEKPFPYEKVERKQKSLRDKGGNALDRRMKMGLAKRRAKESEKTGVSQRDAGKGWYHGR